MQNEYYLRVDECPYDRWYKANLGDLSQLRKGSKGNAENDIIAYELLYNDFIAQIGLSQDYENYLALLLRRAELQLKFIATYKNDTAYRDRTLLNDLNEIEADIAKIEQRDGGEKMTPTAIFARISKMIGSHTKQNEVTVLEYFEYLKMLEEWQKEG